MATFLFRRSILVVYFKMQYCSIFRLYKSFMFVELLRGVKALKDMHFILFLQWNMYISGNFPLCIYIISFL